LPDVLEWHHPTEAAIRESRLTFYNLLKLI